MEPLDYDVSPFALPNAWYTLHPVLGVHNFPMRCGLLADTARDD